MVIFKSKLKKFEINLKMRLCGKKFCLTETIKYLGTKIDADLSWQCQDNDTSFKLKRANAVLFKIKKVLKYPKIP